MNVDIGKKAGDSCQGLSAETRASKPQSPRMVAWITAVLVLSAALNVVLTRRIQTMNAVESAKLTNQMLKVDSTVPSIAVKRLDGQVSVVAYRGASQPTILYIFTPPCSWCARNVDNFKTLVEKEKDQYRIIGLSLSQEGLAEYVAKNRLALPIYSGLSDEAKKAYRLSGTPQTIVVSPEGRVLQNWVGAYAGKNQEDIEAYFHVKLPGLREVPKEEALNTGPVVRK